MAVIGEMLQLTINGKTYTLPSGGGGSVSSVAVSNATNGGLSVSGSPITSSGTITIGHSNVLSSAQTTQAVYPIKIDKNGHISAYGSAITIPTKVSDLTNDSGFVTTDEKLKIASVTSGTTYYPIVGSGTTAATRQYDGTGFSYDATTSTTGYARITLGNSTAQSTSGSKYGQLRLYGTTANATTIVSGSPTSSRTITLPDKTGTIALTSDIPTVSYPVTSVNSKTGAVSLTASDVGALASSTTYVSTITTTAGTHSAISSKSGAVSFNVPTKTSHLTNDSGFITSYTDEKLKISAATSGFAYYPLLGNGASAATRQYDSAFQFSGTNGTANGGGGSTTLTLGNSTTSSTAGWRRGIIQLYGYGAYSTTIENRTSTDNRTIILPDKSGTVALTSDIPDVSGKIDTAGTGLSKSGTTLNHSNSVTAQTTQAVYPIKIDAQGHISAYGSAVTIPTDTKVTQTEISTSSRPNDSLRLLFSNSGISGTVTSGVSYINWLYYNPSLNELTLTGSGTISATNLYGTELGGDTIHLSSGSPSWYDNTLTATGTTANRSYNFPNKSGTIALTSDVMSTTPTLSSTGLTPYSSRCSITSGGIYTLGKWVFVQLQLKNLTSLSANNTWGYLDGFPVPKTSLAGIAVYAVQNYGNISGQINADGRLVLATGENALSVNTVISATGWYIAS